MKEFFVEQIFSGFLVTAFPFAFIAGVISFLSPCVLPLVPGYLSFAAGFSASRGKVLLGSVLFVLGFSLVFVSYGAVFGGLGNQLSANEEYNLCNAFGQSVRHGQIIENTERIDVSDLPRGVYYLKFSDSNRRAVPIILE